MLQLCTCGSNSFGQLGLGHSKDVHDLTLLKISSDHGLNKKESNDENQMNNHGSKPVTQDIEKRVKLIAIGSNHVLLLTQNGQVMVAGDGSQLQLGYTPNPKSTQSHHYFRFLSLNTSVINTTANLQDKFQSDGFTLNHHDKDSNQTSADYCIDFIACGWDSSYCIDQKDHQIIVFGNNRSGQLGLGKDAKSSLPIKLSCFPASEKFTKIIAGISSCIALTETGSVWVWGSNKRSMLGVREKSGDRSNILWTPVLLDLNHKVIDVAIGQYHSLLLTEQGNLYVSGSNKFGQLNFLCLQTHLSCPISSTPIPNLSQKIANKLQNEKSTIKALEYVESTDPISAVHAGWNHTILEFKNNTNQLYLTGKNDMNQLANVKQDSDPFVQKVCVKQPHHSSNCFILSFNQPILRFSSSSESFFVVLKDKTILSSGWNEHGNCGKLSCHESPLSRVTVPLEFGEPVDLWCGYACTFIQFTC